MNGKLALHHVKLLPLLGQLNDRVARDSWQNGAVQWRRDQLLLALLVDPQEKNIHRAHLGHLVVEQPEHLRVALLGCERLRQNSARIVGPELCVACAAGPRAHKLVVRVQLDGCKPFGIVRADL